MDIHVHQFTAMGSPCRILLQCDAELARKASMLAEQEVRRLETKYSRYRDDSLLSEINRCAGIRPVQVDAETAGLLNYADACFSQSDRQFDITSGILRRIWDFRSGILPDENQISETLELIGWDQVEWNQQTIFLTKAGMEIDFGGFGKEYAADRAADICARHGITSGLVDLGGDIHVIGPKQDGSGWAIGVRNPEKPEDAIASLILHQGAMATSGNYERFMTVDGKHYCHILNPVTGWPVQHWASITVLAPQCLVAGSLATLTMLSEQEGLEWIRQQETPFMAIDVHGHQYHQDTESVSA